MSEQFGSVRFDPDAEKGDMEKRGDSQDRRPSDASLAKGEQRRGSVFDRARLSATTLRGSMSRDPGWDKRLSNPMRGSIAEAPSDDDIDYNTLEWWQAGFIMIAETVSLGILSLPSVLATVGMVPGIILIAGLGVLATYSGYVIGQFRLAHPWVHSFGDAGEIMGEKIGMAGFLRELFGWAQTIFLIFSMASHILTWSICLNTITNSATCTIVWGIVGLVIFWILDLPRTLKNVAPISICSFISVTSAVLITMIDVGVEMPIGNQKLSATRTLSFVEAFLSVSNITFAYAGHSCFFGFIAEFREPRDWPKALAMLQLFDTTLYLVAAIVIYRYCGPEVKSPALGSAGPLVKKVAWGIAIPTILGAGLVYGHVAAKYIFVRLFRGTKHMNKRTKIGNLAWIGITGTIWVIAWVIAESIPDFNDLLGLVSALFASWFTYGIPGTFWLYLNWDGEKGTKWRGWFLNWKKCCLFAANVLLFLIGASICVLGLWSSGDAIHNYHAGGSWSCRSNAQ